MRLCVRVVRGLTLSFLVVATVVVGAGIAAVASSGAAFAQSASSIVIEGNRRVESERNLHVRVGDGRVSAQHVGHTLQRQQSAERDADRTEPDVAR